MQKITIYHKKVESSNLNIVEYKFFKEIAITFFICTSSNLNIVEYKYSSDFSIVWSWFVVI